MKLLYQYDGNIDFLGSGLTPDKMLPLVSIVATDRKRPLIPVSIFRSDLAPLEAVVKYLRERFALTYEQLGALLGRSHISIATTYHNAAKKHPGQLQGGLQRVSLRLIAQRRFSVLEAVAASLKHDGHSFSEIGRILGKDPRTIWTAYRRWKAK